MIDEKYIVILNEDIKDGYSQLQLVYCPNNCLSIDEWVKDWERGKELLEEIVDKLKDIDMSKDIEHDKKYAEAVEKYFEEEKKRKRIVA